MKSSLLVVLALVMVLAYSASLFACGGGAPAKKTGTEEVAKG